MRIIIKHIYPEKEKDMLPQDIKKQYDTSRARAEAGGRAAQARRIYRHAETEAD